MLQLPTRGDFIARRLWWVGAIAYLVLVGVLFLSLAREQAGVGGAFRAMLGMSEGGANPAVTALVIVGMALTALATFHLRSEIRDITREEIDIAWVEATKSEGLIYVFEEPKKRERLFKQKAHLQDGFTPPVIHVETLVDDRVRRALTAATSRSSTSSEELRIIAERRTSRWGGLARYISSLLLLLAVLGTFAGVKTALPDLITALSATSGSIGQDAMMRAIQAPLEKVAAAFGGNALALIGAIAVGIMAQGVTFGRRNLLERLELVSTEHIYGQDVSSTSDPIQAAVQMFQVSARDFKDAAGAIAGVEIGLVDLGETFSTSLRQLGEQLTELAERANDEAFDKTTRSLNQLQGRVAELADAIGANAQLYAGLAPALQYRSDDARTAIQEMGRTNSQLAAAMEMIGGTNADTRKLLDQSRTAIETVGGAAERIANVGEMSNQNVVELTKAVGLIQPSLLESRSALSKIADSVSAGDRRLADMWQQFASRIESSMNSQAVQRPRTQEAVTTPARETEAPPEARTTEPSDFTYGNARRPPEARTVSAVAEVQSPEVVKLLRQINETLRVHAPQPKTGLLVWAASTSSALLVGAAAATLWYFMLRR